MLKSEVIALYQALHKLGNLVGVKFAYAVSRNIATLKPEVESLEKALEASPEFLEVDKKRVALAEEHAKKDEKGKPVKFKDGKIEKFEMEDEEAFDKLFEEFKIEHQAVFDAREKQIDEYNALLKTETDVKLHKVSLSDVPNSISVAQMHSISAIIEEAVPTPYHPKEA